METSNPDSSLYVTQEVLSPAKWHSESNCLVGPFSDKHVAQVFIENAAFDAEAIVIDDVFVKGNAWFIAVKENISS